ncbi:MAG TPA: hypothetical protein DD661_07210 [Gammaproteobacteria bacterium]|nr:hypothetical protein [Gammaproteobacteria bacterium]
MLRKEPKIRRGVRQLGMVELFRETTLTRARADLSTRCLFFKRLHINFSVFIFFVVDKKLGASLVYQPKKLLFQSKFSSEFQSLA